MTSVALCSLVGAPGVSTTAWLLSCVWPAESSGRRVLLVDADPAGSGLRDASPVRLAPTAGVVSLAAEPQPVDAEAVLGHAVQLDESRQRYLLPGIALPPQARSVAPIWSSLIEVARDLHVLGMDVIIDAGRWGPAMAPAGLVTEADELLVVIEPSARASLAAASTIRVLAAARAPRPSPRAVVRDSGPYSAAEVADALDTSVLTVADDPRAARAFLDRPGARPDRSPLWRSARSLAAALVAARPAEVNW